MRGLLFVDKPAGITSHDVVSIVRRAARTRRVGHAGTLDPFATGLLVVAIGTCTRLLSYLSAEPKVYEARFRFGAETDTDDATGQITRDAALPDASRLEAALQSLTGVIAQVPPAYSAKHVDGQRAYAVARRGEAVRLAPVAVTVHAWDQITRQGSDLCVRITCAGGTYVRALARDLGRAMHSAAHCAALRRVSSGQAHVAQAVTLAALTPGAIADGTVPLRPPLPLLDDMAHEVLDTDALAALAHGRAVPATQTGARAALLRDGDVVGIADRVIDEARGDRWQPRVVLLGGRGVSKEEHVVHEVLRGLPIGPSGAVITVGVFDGVHRGHQDVLSRLQARAAALGCPSLVITFDPHPLQVVNPPAAPPLLTTLQERLEMFAQSGVSYVAVLPFTPSLAAMEAEQFVDDVLCARFGMIELLVGHDHGFGRGRMGDPEALRTLGKTRGFSVTVLPPVIGRDGQPLSSSVIRRHVLAAELTEASELLGRPYAVGGRVVGGEQRGRVLGYRTINLDVPTGPKLLPPDGVYAVRVQTPAGELAGMLNLGGRPTFGETGRRIETHVFDAEGDWYGAFVRIDFIARLRDTRAFPDARALADQLARDEQAARRLLGRGAGD